jgi:hypothetical protein
MEAFRSGLPAVACYTDGTAQMVTDRVGELLPDSPEREIPGRLKEAIERAFRSRDQLRRKGLYAKSLAEANPFSKAADYIIDLCVTGRDGDVNQDRYRAS